VRRAAMLLSRTLPICLLLACSGHCAAAGGALAEDKVVWQQWKAAHQKTYPSTEVEASRAAIFADNLKLFAERTRHDTANYGPDQWSDMTLAEFKAQQAECFTERGMDAIPAATLPAPTLVGGKQPSVDWRDPSKNSEKVNAVTPPKDQGAYGYCWAFGASGSLEGMNVVQQKNPLQSLSEQELIDCCPACNGGPPQTSWNFFINNTAGVDSTEASYPYNLHARHGDNNQTCALSSGESSFQTGLLFIRAEVAKSCEIFSRLRTRQCSCLGR
jgi:hypothetical protein